MPNRHRCCIAVLILALVGQAVADFPPGIASKNEYDAWRKFKPGTTITFRQEGKSLAPEADQPGGVPSVARHIITMVELTREYASLETKVTFTNLNPRDPQLSEDTTTRRGVRADGKLPEPLARANEAADIATQPATRPWPVTGRETLTINGHRYDCVTVELTSATALNKTITKQWFCDQVPGALVKQVSTMTWTGRRSRMNGESTLILEKVTLGK